MGSAADNRASLLPPNRTAFELAQSVVSAARRPLPSHFIRDVWNPLTCPVDLLPYLAAGLGLEVWHDDWPEARKRAVVADIWRLKRNKTKLKGIKGYLGLADAALVSAHRPRDKRWWVASQTDAERAVQMAAMPQIRIAVAVSPIGGSRAKGFWSGHLVRQSWRAGRCWVPSDAAARNAARATYVDRGVSTPVTLRGTEDPLGAATVVALAATASVARLFWGRRAWGAAVYQASDADARVLAITPSTDAASFAVPTGLVPTAVRPVRTAETAPVRAGQMFWGGLRAGRAAWGGGGVFLASDAAAHLFDAITLFDPARLVPTRQPYSFWGWSRFGRAPYTAELKIDVPLARPARQHGYGKPWGRNAWRRGAMAPFWEAVACVRTSQAVRDTVWLDTRLTAPVRFSAGLRFGDATFRSFGDTRTLQ